MLFMIASHLVIPSPARFIAAKCNSVLYSSSPHCCCRPTEHPEHHGKRSGLMPEAPIASRRQGIVLTSLSERSPLRASPWPRHYGVSGVKRAEVHDPEADLGGGVCSHWAEPVAEPLRLVQAPSSNP